MHFRLWSFKYVKPQITTNFYHSKQKTTTSFDPHDEHDLQQKTVSANKITQ